MLWILHVFSWHFLCLSLCLTVIKKHLKHLASYLYQEGFLSIRKARKSPTRTVLHSFPTLSFSWVMLTNQKASFHLIRVRSEDWRARRGGLCISKFSRSSWAKSVYMHPGYNPGKHLYQLPWANTLVSWPSPSLPTL